MRFIILLLALTSNAYAVDNPRLPIKTNDDLSLHQTNNAAIEVIKDQNKTLNSSIGGHKKCIEQGLIYVGAGATGADTDGCYDLNSTINTETTMRPYFAGFYKDGNASPKVVSFKTLDPAYEASLAGRFNIDKACHNEYPSSRALTFEDLKYVLPTLNLPLNIDHSPIWVMDGIRAMSSSSTDMVITKNGSIAGKMYDCEGWNTSEEFYSGIVLMKETGVTPNYLKVINSACDTGARIACVYN